MLESLCGPDSKHAVGGPVSKHAVSGPDSKHTVSGPDSKHTVNKGMKYPVHVIINRYVLIAKEITCLLEQNPEHLRRSQTDTEYWKARRSHEVK